MPVPPRRREGPRRPSSTRGTNDSQPSISFPSRGAPPRPPADAPSRWPASPTSAEGPGKASRSSSASSAASRLNQVVVGAHQRLRNRLTGFAQPWEVACFLWIPTLVVGFTAWYELHNKATLGDFPI